MTQTYRTSRSFSRKNDDGLASFTQNVADQMTDNPGFSTPLVPIPILSGQLVKFREAITAAMTGDRVEIARRNVERLVLDNLLRQEAAYVEGIANNNLPLLLSSGFEVASNNRVQIELTKPVIDRVDNPASAQLALRLQPVPTARAYEVRLSFNGGSWQNAGVFTQARKIVLTDLTPGTTYTIQARAIGGSTGSSDWSDPVSHMSL